MDVPEILRNAPIPDYQYREITNSFFLGEVSDIYLRQDTDLKPVIDYILRSSWFLDPANSYARYAWPAEFVARLFTHRRKQLGTILGRDAARWPEAVTPDLRPESLRVDQIVALWRLGGR